MPLRLLDQLCQQGETNLREYRFGDPGDRGGDRAAQYQQPEGPGGHSEFGTYAQDVLNDQIVDDSDAGIVVFTDRLGTPTDSHESGTAEKCTVFVSVVKTSQFLSIIVFVRC
jgi:hypothetical protein